MENYVIANRTDVGRARQVNEDSMITFDSPNGRVVAVCDGMGGQAAGDVASKLACDIIRDILTNNKFENPADAITSAIMAANQGILHRASQQPELEGMGATCVMLIINDDIVNYGWVGDSRIYILDNHTLHQISRDQSYVQMLVDQGEITAEEAETHPQKNEILNALGVEGMTPPEIGEPIHVHPGMVFMLCSDGLSNMVNDKQIEHELNKPDITLQEKANKLVFLANQYGGTDNITLQLVEFGAPQMHPTQGATAKGAKKAKQKSSLMPIIVFLAVLLIGIAAYFVFFNNKPAEPVAPVEIKTTVPQQQKQTAPEAKSKQEKVIKETTKEPAKKAATPKKKDTPQGALEGATGGKTNPKEEVKKETKEKTENDVMKSFRSDSEEF